MSDDKKTCGNCGWAVDMGSSEGWVTCAQLAGCFGKDQPVKAGQSAPNCWEEPKNK